MAGNWVDVSAEHEVPQEDVLGVEAHGREIALYGVEGRVYASDGICTHGHARLCDGFLEDYEIECPLHQGRFDIRSGRAMCAPVTEDIKVYPVKIEGGRVFVDLG